MAGRLVGDPAQHRSEGNARHLQRGAFELGRVAVLPAGERRAAGVCN